MSFASSAREEIAQRSPTKECCVFRRQTKLEPEGHDGEPQLRILVKGVDIVVLEIHTDAEPQQLARVAEAVKGVSGETADLF